VQIEALQTGTVTVREAQREGRGHGRARLLNTLRDKRWTEPLPIHAWLIRHPEGNILVDTGETARAMEPGYFPRWHPYFRRAVRMSVDPANEIDRELERVGVRPDAVRWVVLTHMHTDHAGGLSHFPGAEILVASEELRTASGVGGRINGYLPNRWPKWFAPRQLDFGPDPLGPFPETLPLTDAGDVRIVSTPGHSPGHMSVLVDEGDGNHVFLAGDTSYSEGLMLRGAVDGVGPDERAMRTALERIRELARDRRVVYLPTHDPESPRRLAERIPAPVS
jgi:N-acyl homoserine lactone hydrolase